jgi:hypothetical protein
MDSTTVLEIIEMLDTRIKYYDELNSCDYYEIGCQSELTNFRNHLQSFIEGQLNAAENQTEQ